MSYPSKINSWKDFLIAVERMRECQKEYFRTKSSSALNASKMQEAVVDNCIKLKRAEWANPVCAPKQPELV